MSSRRDPRGCLQNLGAIAEFEDALPGLELIFVESGGDNLAAAFSPELVDVWIYVKPVGNCRRIGKQDMVHDSATPNIEVDPETYEVRVDGALITCEPASVLPLAQRYFLFMNVSSVVPQAVSFFQ